MTKEKKEAPTTALVVHQPPPMTPDDYKMIDALAVRYARSELAPSWCRGKPDNVAIAMVNGHALGLHLAVAINNGFVVNGHYDVYGPAYLGLAQGRDPLFDYTIDEWTDETCTLTGWRGNGEKHTLTVTRAQLARNAATAKNPSFASNPQDHLMWKASKRLVRLVSPAVTIGLALPSEEQVEREEPVAPAPKSVDNLLDDVIGPQLEQGTRPATVATSSTPAKPQPEAGTVLDPVMALSARIVKMYGKMTKAVALEKASIVYNQMMKDTQGEETKIKFTSAADIGSQVAANMLKYLDEHDAKRAARHAERDDGGRGDATEGGDGTAPMEAASGTDAAPAREPGDDDEAPPADAPAPEAAPAPAGYDGLMLVVKRARKLFAKDMRLFVKESPPGSGSFWYTDQETFATLGYHASVHLMKAGELKQDDAAYGALAQVLADYCDTHERKGR